MKTIYLDADFMCHITDDGTMTPVETDVFDGVVDAAIQFYRYIPENSEWVDERGRQFYGLFVQATDSDSIDRVTREFAILDMQTALEILGVSE